MPPVRGEKNNFGANPVWHIPLCFESEFEALKTSPPHGLAGLAAIKTRSKTRRLNQCAPLPRGRLQMGGLCQARGGF